MAATSDVWDTPLPNDVPRSVRTIFDSLRRWLKTVFMSSWVSYTPTVKNSGFAAVTATVTYAKYQRIGKTIRVQVRLDITSNSGGAGEIRVTMPVVPAATTGLIVGTFGFWDSSGLLNHRGTAENNTITGEIVGVRDQSGLFVSINTQLGTGDIVWVNAEYEVA